MDNQQPHPHAKLLADAATNFSLLCDAVCSLDYTHLSDEEFGQLYASFTYGSKRLTKSLNAALALKFKQQIRVFIDTFKADYPSLRDVDLSMYEGERLQKLHHLLFIDPLPLFKKLKKIQTL